MKTWSKICDNLKRQRQDGFKFEANLDNIFKKNQNKHMNNRIKKD